MKDFQIIVSENILTPAKDELFVLGAVCAVIVAITVLFVCKELKRSGKGEDK